MTNTLRQLADFGQSVWYDNIQRTMITSGQLKRMIEEDGLRGITSNPTIFEKAINGSKDYDDYIVQLLTDHPRINTRDLFFSIAIRDIQEAADLLMPVYQQSNGVDGMISLEVSPDLAYDTEGTIAEARRLAKRVDRRNLMIKVPATKEGLPAIEAIIADGINVNVTLLFSVERYKEVIEAYTLGLESRLRRGQPVSKIASVASFFVSRVDAAIEQQMKTNTSPELSAVAGKIGIANAKIAYSAYKQLFGAPRFAALKEAGAATQRLLWASTGTKNPTISDVIYLDNLIGPDTVNTVPPATYAAFKDHGTPQASLERDVDKARSDLAALAKAGVSLADITKQLEKDGVESFGKSFTTLLSALEGKAELLREKMRSHA